MISPLLVLASLAFVVSAQDDGLTVSTQQGPITGTQITPNVRRWLGVPYAVADRWQLAQTVPVQTEPFMATEFSDSCLQALTPANIEFLVLSGANETVTESETCLTLNIWAPSTSRKQNTSVMIWAHGGHSQYGTANIAMTDGQNFVNDQDDIILVTVNYRLNIFGQPGAPQLAGQPDTQNFGIIDVGTAIHWVNDNIAGFGGDPERITVFGQSAGAAALDAYTYVHANDVIVKGVIQQSGNLFIDGNALVSDTLNASVWNQVADAVGCGTINDDAQFACMKAVDGRTLEDAVIGTNTQFNFIADDLIMFTNRSARAAAGEFLHVPYLSGTNKNELDVFIVADQLVNTGFSVPAVTPLLSDVGSQLAFTCPISDIANDRFQTGVPTFRYQYEAAFADISTHPDLRTYHASEIPIIFGTFNSTDPSEIALSKYMQGAWAAFARDPMQGLVNYGWPVYSPDTLSLAVVGGLLNTTGVTFNPASLVDFVCTQQDTLASVRQELADLLASAASLTPPM